MKNSMNIIIATFSLAMIFTACKKDGCTDPVATNYDKKANVENNSCIYGAGGGGGAVITDEIKDDITTNTTIKAGVVKICTDINVSAVLTVEPGVIFIMCAGSSLDIEETGAIKANGTAALPIVFKGETETAGFWEGIAIKSNNPNNQFNYVTVKDAGTYWGWDYANLYIANGAQLTMKNSTVSNSQSVGLFAENSSTIPGFSNNTFSNNGTIGLNINSVHVGSLDGASNYNISNTESYIHVRGVEIGINQTWQKLDTPLLLNATTKVSAGLTLMPGVSILMESGADFSVAASGYLNATGTAVDRITIFGRYTAAAYWDGIKIYSTNPNNKFNYVSIGDAGAYWGFNYATIDVDGRIEMNNTTITNSNSWAVYMRGSSSIYCSGVVQTTPEGVTAVNTLSGNGVGPDADCVDGGCTIYFD
ncbi:hypothetical protein [Crocinitomix catalasitica]|uniref:hypothetical protein n=1 Tax=Crocinitomix catalasitica TaxID=184607 RepID=UPI0012FCCB5F|nr:hypothetical protein [Crocinitomix catalasitica]